MKLIYNGLIYEHFNYKNPIKGGVGDNLKKIDKKQLALGVGVEKEHIKNNEDLTDSQKNAIAKDISKDHLEEIPDYYTRLIDMEKEAKDELDLENSD